MVNLLCSEDHFSNIAFIDAKTKDRIPYLLDVSQLYLKNHIRTSLGRSQDVSEGCPQDVGKTPSLNLNIRPCEDVLITSAEDVLKTSVGDFPWRYIQDSMGTESVLASEIKTFFHKAHYVTYRSKAQCLLKITSETLVHLLTDDEINPSHKTLLVIHQSKESFIMKSF